MFIVQHSHVMTQRVGGELRLPAADCSLGIDAFQVWLHRLEPGAHGVACRHDGELVVLVQAGCGKLLLDGGPQRLAAPCTVLVPQQRTFQFVNHGVETLQMVLVCTRAPVPCVAGDDAAHTQAHGPSPSD